MIIPTPPSVVLFGYEASTFTLKVRLALKLKQIQYTFVAVPSMMPRPLLKNTFNLTYRKIPVLAIGRDIYCDTSLICEALEHFFPESEGYQSLYPASTDGRNYRSMIRGFASYWTDRPLFRVTTGLMPASIWRTSFGRDRERLIGHAIDADKLEKKLPEHLSRLDMHFSILEPGFDNGDQAWIFSTASPSLADVSLYYQLAWGSDISSGKSTHSITAGETQDPISDIVTQVFNAQRYPRLFAWYKTLERYFANLPEVEEVCSETDFEAVVVKGMNASPSLGRKSWLLPTPRNSQADLDAKSGLIEGKDVSVVPDDTGRDDPTIGSLLALSPEEIVIKPRRLDPPAKVDVRIHFPRLGFVARPAKADEPKL